MKYVGQTHQTLGRRWSHLKHARTIDFRPIGRAMLKFGVTNFDIRPLLIVGSREELDFYETKCISAFHSLSPEGYNLALGGRGVRGVKASLASRLKISKSKIGKKRPPQVGKAVGEANRKRIWSDEAKAKSRKRFSEAMTGYWARKKRETLAP